MSSINEINDDSMLYASFNQDNSFFSIGTERGFRIYQTYPLAEPYERVMNGGIGVVEMLYKSNFLALMGGGKVPKYGKNKLVIWDDHENKVISELKFSTTIINVKLKKDFLFVVCQKRIYVFDFNTYETIDTIDTSDNKNELIAINSIPDYTVLAYPSQKGENKISIKNYNNNRKTFNFKPQDDSVSKMSINNIGTLIATSNEAGTFIRIHSCNDGTFLQEFKRGIEKAKINYICFDNDSKLMAVSSSRGTIHIFSMGSTIKKLKEHEKKKELIKAKQKEKKKEDEKENGQKKIEKNEKEAQKEKVEQKEKEDEKLKEEGKNEEEKEEKVKEKNENIEKKYLKEENNNIIINKDEDKDNIILNDDKEINKKEEKTEEEIKNEINENIINENNNIENKENNKGESIKNDEELPENAKTFLGGIFGSQTEKSFAQVRIKKSESICAFAKNNILVIISSDNKYYQATIDIKKGGNCKVISESLIKKPIKSSQFEII